MRNWIITVGILASAALARAHFVFVVPDAQGQRANVILSEDLDADEDVKVSELENLALSIKASDGAETPAKIESRDSGFVAALPGAGSRVVHGTVEWGVTRRGKAEPFLLTYHPKTILGDAFDQRSAVGSAAPVEIVPLGKAGEVKFQVIAGGKPLPNAEVNLILPDGSRKVVPTDKEGATSAFAETGRYGAWARFFEDKPGERKGEAFKQIRHYATLVIDVPAASAAASSAAAVSKDFPQLPEAISSFGAVACEGYLYVYGGHTAPTHTYSTQAVSGRFWRINLAAPKSWEELPSGPRLQGMNLATHGGKIYRVGGMDPRNAPGAKADNYSVTTAARYDPAAGKWEELAALPSPRSSHDLAVLGNQLYVLGGWDMRGRAGGNHWLDHMNVLNLADAGATWQAAPQAFERRALIAAVHQGKIYVLGGFTEESDPMLRVDIFDPASKTWSQGPDLPGKDENGFAPAACELNGRLYVSVGDGGLYRLAGEAWEKVATTTPRIVHRLVPSGSSILVIGGAAKGDNLNLIEQVTPTDSRQAAAERD